MKKYIIAQARTLAELEEKVNVYVADGYTPTGGVSVHNYNHSYGFYQAMIHETVYMETKLDETCN